MTSWLDKYKNKIVAAKEALKAVKSGDRVVTGHACGEPQALVAALVERAAELRDVEIVHMVAMGAAKYAQPGMEKSFRHNALFIGASTRKGFAEGRADYTPCFFHEIPRLFKNDLLPVDVALIQVTPPDADGFCSYGLSVDYTMAAAETAKTLIVQVNPLLPRTGGAKILLDKAAHIVLKEEAVIELTPPKIGDVERKIGEHIASLIPDGRHAATGHRCHTGRGSDISGRQERSWHP